MTRFLCQKYQASRPYSFLKNRDTFALFIVDKVYSFFVSICYLVHSNYTRSHIVAHTSYSLLNKHP